MILAVIPARGGSKSIPRKNIRLLNGKSLINWSIEVALQSKLIDRCLLSTDDDEIRKIAETAGAEVQMRPAELATDTASTLSVLQHVLTKVDADTVVLLQPTSPIRTTAMVDQAIQLFLDKDVDSVATGFNCQHFEWGTIENLPRQEIKGFFYDNGSVYVHKASSIMEGRWTGEKKYGLIVDQMYHYEIDTELDFIIVEHIHKLFLQ